MNHSGFIFIEAEVLDYSNSNTELESVITYWKYSNEDGPFSEIELELESDSFYTGTFPSLNPNTIIEYFISFSIIMTKLNQLNNHVNPLVFN